MKKTGQLLRESREKQKISLDEVTLTTKINVKFLQSMEEGDIANLPPWTFTRGFLRTYARYLKLDEDLVMSMFEEEVGTPNQVSRPDENAHPLLNVDSESITTEPTRKQETEKTFFRKVSPFMNNLSVTSKILSLAGIVLLVFLIVSLKTVVEKYGMKGEVSSPEESLTVVEQTVTGPEHMKDGKTHETVRNTETVKGETKNKYSLKEEPEIKAPKSELKTEPEVVIKKEEKEIFRQAPRLSSPHEVFIEALDDVSIDYRIDGGKLEHIQMGPDEVFTIKAKRKVAIDFSDGSVINLVHNGVDRGVPGKPGAPIKVRFP
jgi:cytoskeletal protein RodZ